ncbi:hypothetical protein ACLB1O_19960 [Escherichia coli]
MLDGLVEWAPAPMPRQTDTRTVEASEDKFTGFRDQKFRPTWTRNTATAWRLCA